MGHNSGDSIGGSTGPPAGSGAINKRHRGSPRNPAKNPAGQLRSNSAETQMHSNKPRLVCCFHCLVHLLSLATADKAVVQENLQGAQRFPAMKSWVPSS